MSAWKKPRLAAKRRRPWTMETVRTVSMDMSAMRARTMRTVVIATEAVMEALVQIRNQEPEPSRSTELITFCSRSALCSAADLALGGESVEKKRAEAPLSEPGARGW